jgi:predicted DCC family thiol-disulfide oxidoreductase YuxK
MNTLKDHVILYDAECPMCKVYTRAFTTTGMLDKEGRVPYQDMPDFACPVIDQQRAVNEIALVNKRTGEVNYGIDSLFKVIAHSFPVFGPLFRFAPFVWLMRKVYAFISYNRKVIIPAPKGHVHAIQPAFRLRYRLAWLLFTVGVAGYILTAYAKLFTGLLPAGNSYREYLICGGQLLFQGLIVSLYAPSRRWDYLGNMMTISLAGALLLLPGLAIAAISHLSPVAAAAYFLFIAGLMLLEHIRRSKLLSLGWVLTISWVCYRVVVLAIIARR